MSEVVLESVLVCPVCGFAKREKMPTDACRFFYECDGCKTVLRPKPGDCCVFCSYGSVKWSPDAGRELYLFYSLVALAPPLNGEPMIDSLLIGRLNTICPSRRANARRSLAMVIFVCVELL